MFLIGYEKNLCYYISINYFQSNDIRAFPAVNKNDQHLKLYFVLKINFLRFSLKLKGCEFKQ